MSTDLPGMLVVDPEAEAVVAALHPCRRCRGKGWYAGHSPDCTGWNCGDVCPAQLECSPHESDEREPRESR